MGWIIRLGLISICLFSFLKFILKLKGTNRIKGLLFFVYLLTIIIFLIFFGDYMNENQFFGMLSVGIMIISFSCISYLYGSFSVRKQIPAKLKWTFYISNSALVLSFLHMPIWFLRTRQFPIPAAPIGVAIIYTLLIVFSLFAPLTPMMMLRFKNQR